RERSGASGSGRPRSRPAPEAARVCPSVRQPSTVLAATPWGGPGCSLCRMRPLPSKPQGRHSNGKEKPGMRIFAAFLAWPLVEIALFVVIGGWIGLWPTLIWVVLSALLGIMVMRLTAARQAMALRDGLRGLRDPA